MVLSIADKTKKKAEGLLQVSFIWMLKSGFGPIGDHYHGTRNQQITIEDIH